jgi:cystathionine beta-lyase/cystathionine gamma-synthase
MNLDPADVALCVAGAHPDTGDEPSPLAPPVVQTSLFAFPSFQALVDGLAGEHRSTVYTRGRNPTRRAVETTLAKLERGGECSCFASGMAAVSAVLTGVLQQGDHVLFVNNVYGPTLQLARRLTRFGVEHDVLLDLGPDAVRGALRPNTRLVWMESPGTMLFRVLDVEAVAGVAREHGALSCLDNSWSTPLLQKPLEMGVDLVVHSATKYLAGHSDVMAGAVVSSAERMQELFYRSFLLLGGILAPFDSWLLLRGLRTLPARLRQHEADALQVARFLAGHPAVARVHHPALSEDRALAERQLRGYSGLLSFELRKADFATVRSVIDRLEHFRIGVSWGGVESLVISPERDDDGVRLTSRGTPRGLLRLSVGLEGADLLIEDLARALDAAT